jgi:hypothetical protein
MRRLLLALLGLSSIAAAGTVTVTMTVDNAFTAYISTSDSVLGTQILTGTTWEQVLTTTEGLANATNYLHVVATNEGGPGGVVGQFSLSDPAFQFANGSQSLLTDAAYWTYSSSGFGSGMAAPVGYHQNDGLEHWPVRPGISQSAYWIWDSVTENAAGPLYFSTPIFYQGSDVPEPATFGLLGAGLALGFLYRRARA